MCTFIAPQAFPRADLAHVCELLRLSCPMLLCQVIKLFEYMYCNLQAPGNFILIVWTFRMVNVSVYRTYVSVHMCTHVQNDLKIGLILSICVTTCSVKRYVPFTSDEIFLQTVISDTLFLKSIICTIC